MIRFEYEHTQHGGTKLLINITRALALQIRIDFSFHKHRCGENILQRFVPRNHTRQQTIFLRLNAAIYVYDCSGL